MKERGMGRASGGKGPRPFDPARGASRAPDPGENGDATRGGAYPIIKPHRRL